MTTHKFKALNGMALKLDWAGFQSAHYLAIVPNDIELTDVFPPTFWVHHQAQLRQHDRVRLRRQDGAFDVEVTVVELVENGAVRVAPWPKLADLGEFSDDDKAAAAKVLSRSAELTVAPLGSDGLPKARVEYLEATGWRVRGWDGHEVSRDHKSEADAKKALGLYLEKMNMVMPSPQEIAKAQAETAAKKKQKVGAQ